MSEKGRRRGWRRHEGVAIVRRGDGKTHRARWLVRYRDPDTGEVRHETIPAELTTEEQRSVWAAKRASALRKREEQISLGAPTKKGATLEDAVARYFANVSAVLRPKTLRCYRQSANAFLTWARIRRLEMADDLRGEHLADLRAWIANKKLRSSAKGKGKGRGARVEVARVRSPGAVNREIREVKVILEALRRLGLVPLTRDSIADNLKLAKMPRPLPKPLRVVELVKLIDAAKRHDAEVFTLTREEKKRREKGGKVTRHVPVLPYLTTVLLSGMRADEARLLKWARVDLTLRQRARSASSPRT
jgi:integrase